MGQEKLVNFFKDPLLEYEHILADLNTRLNPDVADEIVAFVDKKTTDSMDNVWRKLKDRYEAVSQLDEQMPEKPTKEDQQNYIQEFFNLTDPSKVSQDLQRALNLDEIESDYLAFINKMVTQEHGEIFERYVYPPHFFNGLKQAILHNISQLTNALKSYTDQVAKHALVMDAVHKEQKDKAFIKGGASLLGLLVGIPFAGAGVGALMGDDQAKINESLDNVFDGWNAYINRFNSFLTSLDEHYRLAMMTLYGGTFLRVNDQFRVYHWTFKDLATLSGDYRLCLTKNETNNTRKWINETTKGIEVLIKKKNWDEAIKVAQRLFQIVQQKPITAREEILREKSTIYVAHLYYYIAYQEALLEEYRNKHFDSFYQTTKKLYTELPLLIKDGHISSDFSTKGHLLFRFVKEALKREETDDLLIILEYLKRLGDRFETHGMYIGEHFSSKEEFTEEFYAFNAIESFLDDVLGIRMQEDDEEKIKLTQKQLKAVIELDKEIGHPDSLTKYFKKQYRKTFIPSWMKTSKKTLAAVILTGAVLIGGYTYGEEAYQFGKEQIADLGWFSPSEKTEPVQTPEPTYLQITTEYANIRSNASLNSDVVHTNAQEEPLVFLEEIEIDGDGREWYYVETMDGKRGWISSTIVEEIMD